VVTTSTKVVMFGLGVTIGVRVIVNDVVATASIVLIVTTVEVEMGEVQVHLRGFANSCCAETSCAVTV